ncbi:MAG: hypothetical protein OEZ31_05220 [Nitrospirota bacterium]|nr:hypothetical protein [Nitrospirota bacterium]MDH5768341.1 hypothetical protein [Nitrospirota bacterium]
MPHQTLPQHLKEQFLREFNPAERIFFLKKARESLIVERYSPCEDLYHYCYFMTLKERIRSLSGHDAGGLARYLVVEGTKDVEEAITMYKKRLEKNRRFASLEERDQFLRYLEGPD